MLIVLIWFTVYVYEVLPGYRVGFVAVSDSEPKGAAPVTVLSFFSATNLTLAATALCLLTSLSTWCVMASRPPPLHPPISRRSHTRMHVLPLH